MERPGELHEVVGHERLESNVQTILQRIERELDAVDIRIGEKMHVLDVDNDGLVRVDRSLHRGVLQQVNPDLCGGPRCVLENGRIGGPAKAGLHTCGKTGSGTNHVLLQQGLRRMVVVWENMTINMATVCRCICVDTDLTGSSLDVQISKEELQTAMGYLGEQLGEDEVGMPHCDMAALSF